MQYALVIRRGISRGILTLFREKQWKTALGALFGVFILVQMMVLVFTGLEGVKLMLKNRTDLRLELQQGASEAQVQRFYTELSQQPFVRDTVYITKEKAYQQTRTTDPELIAFLEEFNIENPFFDTIGVTLASLDEYENFAAFTEREEWQTIVKPTFLSEITDQEKHVFALLDITRAGRALTISILMITFGALIFITTELVRRRAIGRQDEVLVERLSGATPLSILVPFITEAALLLWAAILTSALLFLVLAYCIPLFVPALSLDGVLSSVYVQTAPLMRTMLPSIFLLQICIAPIIAFAGAWVGIRPQIRRPQISR